MGLHNPAREPLAEPISKLEYEFEKRKLTVEEVRDLIYREVLEYHPQIKREARRPARAARRRAKPRPSRSGSWRKNRWVPP